MVKKNCKTWERSKLVRINWLGRYCELCGDYLEIMVGHHVKNKKDASVVDNDVMNCQLRCEECEKSQNSISEDGNTIWSDLVHQRNNRKISELLPFLALAIMIAAEKRITLERTKANVASLSLFKLIPSLA